MSFTFTDTEAAQLVQIIKTAKVWSAEDSDLLQDLIEAIEERDLIDFEGEQLSIDPDAIAKDNEEFFEILRNK